jgi:hypothetical protein
MNLPGPFLLFSGMPLLFSVCMAVAQKLSLAWQIDKVFRVPCPVLIDPAHPAPTGMAIDGPHLYVADLFRWRSWLLALPEGIYVAYVSKMILYI